MNLMDDIQRIMQITGYTCDKAEQRLEELGTVDAVVAEFRDVCCGIRRTATRDETQQKYDAFRRDMEEVSREVERKFPTNPEHARAVFAQDERKRNF